MTTNLRVERHREVGDVEAERLGLEVEDLQRQGVALLGEAAEGEGLLLRGRASDFASSWSG